jgi:hypothetical protein
MADKPDECENVPKAVDSRCNEPQVDRDTNQEMAERAFQNNQTAETNKKRQRRTKRATSGIRESRYRRSAVA